MIRLIEIGIGMFAAAFLLFTTLTAQPVPRPKPVDAQGLAEAEPIDHKQARADERKRLRLVEEQMKEQTVQIDGIDAKLDQVERLVREKEAERAERERSRRH